MNKHKHSAHKQQSYGRKPLYWLAVGAFAASTAASGITVTDITGGTVKPLENYEHVCTFTNSGSFTVTQPGTMDILVVGGGGSGGNAGGGGGGGAVVYSEAVSVSAGTYDVVVGAGGIGMSKNGSASSIAQLSLSAPGGGGGGWINGTEGRTGANGGGGGMANMNYSQTAYRYGPGGKSNWTGGHRGGDAFSANSTNRQGGGGGGAGEDGHHGTNDTEVSYGGRGLAFSIIGEERYYGGGGGGGSYSKICKGGLGGGGAGGVKSGDGTSGTPNTGGGGGGSGSANTGSPGNGGSGVVILRYRVSSSCVKPRDPLAGGEATKVRKNGKKTYVNCFTNNGTFVVTRPVVVDVLLVGGGAGGGFYAGGGGAGGAVVQLTNLVLNAGSYDVVVGAGGVGLTNQTAKADMYGGETSFLGYVAPGGGAGGWINGDGGKDGANGGGGGTCNAATVYTSPGGTNTWAAGHVGGKGYSTSAANLHGGGGGGAGEAGHDSTSDTANPGYGGAGLPCDFYSETRYYGGGGGGGSSNYATHGLKYGGQGGGGMGGYMTLRASKREELVVEEPVAGTSGTGGGGGGGWGYGNFGGNGANGGCGCVLIRYQARPRGMVVVAR